METFKSQNVGKPFTLIHCWREIKDCPKWKELVASMKRGGGVPAGGKEEPSDKRPKGRTNAKIEAKREVQTIALQDTLKGFISQKDKSTEKREDGRRGSAGREENSKNFFEIQKRKLDIEEENARSTTIEVKAKAREAEHALLTEKTRIMTADLDILTPRKRAWFEKKHKWFMERDD